MKNFKKEVYKGIIYPNYTIFTHSFIGKLSTMNNILDILSQLLKMLERRLPLQPCIKKEGCPPWQLSFLFS
jgi:hypothetical protein